MAQDHDEARNVRQRLESREVIGKLVITQEEALELTRSEQTSNFYISFRMASHLINMHRLTGGWSIEITHCRRDSGGTQASVIRLPVVPISVDETHDPNNNLRHDGAVAAPVRREPLMTTPGMGALDRVSRWYTVIVKKADILLLEPAGYPFGGNISEDQRRWLEEKFKEGGGALVVASSDALNELRQTATEAFLRGPEAFLHNQID